MLVVYVIGEDWTLRTGIRAELREAGIDALGLETASDVGAALTSGEMPSAVVLDSASQAAFDPAIQALLRRVPAVVIASRTTAATFGPSPKVLFRPVQIREVVSAVRELLKGQAA